MLVYHFSLSHDQLQGIGLLEMTILALKCIKDLQRSSDHIHYDERPAGQ